MGMRKAGVSRSARFDVQVCGDVIAVVHSKQGEIRPAPGFGSRVIGPVGDHGDEILSAGHPRRIGSPVDVSRRRGQRLTRSVGDVSPSERSI